MPDPTLRLPSLDGQGIVVSCGHARLGGDWIYADDRGCIDGTWYIPCSEPNCTGQCETAGDCGCPGCDSTMCCTKD